MLLGPRLVLLTRTFLSLEDIEQAMKAICLGLRR